MESSNQKKPGVSVAAPENFDNQLGFGSAWK